MKKTVYFVRHGESEGNVGPIRQTAATPLTDKGRQQAEFVAARCARLEFDTMICSTMIRARQTADAILAATPHPVEYSDLFIERRRTSAEGGKPKDDPELVELAKSFIENFTVPNFRIADEENFEDLRKRAQDALAYLVARPEKNLLVVTHGLFMRIVAGCVIFGDTLNARECLRFIQTLSMQNTGITVLEYDDSRTDIPWRFWIWNDHAHLADAS